MMKHCNLWLFLVICGLGLGLYPRPAAAEQLLNLPLPSDGLRYPSYAAIELQWPAVHGTGSVCLWGEDRFAAVSISIDDNNAPDFPFWRQVSADYGWKLTWFVIVHPYVWDIYNNVTGSNTGYSGTIQQFKDLYDEGHDIQLHGATAMNDLNDAAYDDQIVRSVAKMESVIGNEFLTFAYPSGEIDGDSVGSRRSIAETHFVAARGTSGGATPVFNCDYLVTKSMGTGTDRSATSFWAKMEQKPTNIRFSSYRGWATLLFHKVNDPVTTLATMDYVKANEDAGKYWVRPYTHVARYAQERESSTLTVTRATASKIECTLTDRMHDGIFQVPLTLKFRTNGWTGVAAHQDGTAVPARLVTYEGATYTLVDAVPDRGPIALRATLPDVDADGMADLWETEYGLNPADPLDAALDADGDGRSNLQEYLGDTHPVMNSDRMVNWLEKQGDTFHFAFRPIPHWATPLVEYSPNLVDWYPLTPSVFTRDSGVMRIQDPTTPQGRRFYRLKLVKSGD